MSCFPEKNGAIFFQICKEKKKKTAEKMNSFFNTPPTGGALAHGAFGHLWRSSVFRWTHFCLIG